MNIINKKLLYTAATFITILCSACSIQTSPAGGNEITVNDSIADIENTETTDNITASQNDENYDSVSAQITFFTKEDSDSTDDGNLLYTSHCTYPVVEMAGNENAADKINTDIQTRVDAFLADTSIREYAKEIYEDYQLYTSNAEIESENSFYGGYYYDFDTIVTRNDSNVISFLIKISSYSGGTRGDYHCIGLNFNAKTGESIVFLELSENPEIFRSDTLAYLKKLAATDTYQSIMWEDKSIWKEDSSLEKELFHDERWYLSTYGLVFFSHPYFYAGEIEFAIPYAALEEMGFQGEYSYHENMTIKLQTEAVCSFDLNGDGVEEEIQFYIDEPGHADADVHFILNDIDYASQHEELASQFSANEYLFYWAQCFLYDMDTEDDTIEVAFQMNYREDHILTPHTFLYRYQKNELFTFLGMIEGPVTDPAFSPEKLLLH